MASATRRADTAVVDYYRCPPEFARIKSESEPSAACGYFTVDGLTAFGHVVGATPARYCDNPLTDVLPLAKQDSGELILPFGLSEVVTNLRQERYRRNGHGFLERLTTSEGAQRLYYLIRPLMSVGVRKHLQKVRFSGWNEIPFPSWPVDTTVDDLMARALRAVIANGEQPVPFVWFWPDGAETCLMMTHDVEGRTGTEFCDELMDLDEAHGIKSAFQLIPENREDDWRRAAARLRARGFEVNLHDLNHDGLLFADRQEFLDRARRINQYARQFGCDGFRSGAMYREQDWYDAFEFSYDMSVPNAAHLEPQRGGCCTVMPYFIGDILELPLTTVQDYTLFHILNDYSIELWKEQIARVVSRSGLVSVIAHPDYLVGVREREVYVALLQHINELRQQMPMWVALPGEVNTWWRNRRQMTLVESPEGWRVEGPGSERARVAYATWEGDQVVYRLS